MRTNDTILNQANKDITLEKHKEDAHLWLEVRKIEVLIDIRDILHDLSKDFVTNILDLARES